MNIFGDSSVHGTRKIKVDHVHHVLDIQTASRNASGNENRASGRAEGASFYVLERLLVDKADLLTEHLHAHAECDRSGWRYSGAPC